MINSFNTNIAVQYGVNISIFCQQLAQWTFLNLANRRNIHEGLCWSYNTLDAYTEIFPFWSRRQLELIINHAVKAGLIKKGNFNQHKYDRTIWYALTIEGLKFYPELTEKKYLEALSNTISPNCEMHENEPSANTNACFHFTKRGNGDHQNVTTIPTNKPTNNISKDIYSDFEKVDKNKTKKSAYELAELIEDNPHDIPKQMLEDWLVIRKDKKARVTKTAWDTINKTLSEIKEKLNINPIDAFGVMVASCWQSLKLEWFNKSDKQNINEKLAATDDTSWGKDFHITNTLGFYHE